MLRSVADDDERRLRPPRAGDRAYLLADWSRTREAEALSGEARAVLRRAILRTYRRTRELAAASERAALPPGMPPEMKAHLRAFLLAQLLREES